MATIRKRLEALTESDDKCLQHMNLWNCEKQSQDGVLLRRAEPNQARGEEVRGFSAVRFRLPGSCSRSGSFQVPVRIQRSGARRSANRNTEHERGTMKRKRGNSREAYFFGIVQ